MSHRGLLAALVSVVLGAVSLAHAADFDLRDGDRVVLLGDALFEREQQFGYWETTFTAAHPRRQVVFRNLGWSGDTVWAESRGYFDPPAKGYQNLLELVAELKPTVILVAYGANESFAGAEGVEAFGRQLNQLLDDLARHTPRLLLLTPLPGETVDPRLPPAEAHRQRLEPYAAVIRQTAQRRRLPLVDLLAHTTFDAAHRYTDNGLHLNERGYRLTADQLAALLGMPALNERFDAPVVEQLRQAIVAKNSLFFHRWRPQNQTYLFGFRKHEQGQNAREIAEFDPLVAEAEARVAALRSALSD